MTELAALHDAEKTLEVTQANRHARYPTYKPSGVDWLGEVPEHWGVKRLKHFTRMRSGENITYESIEDNGLYPVYGGNGIRGYTSAYTHDGEFVLVGRQGALCGNIHRASGKFWASEHCTVATPQPDVVPDWLAALIEVMDLGRYSATAAQPGLAVEKVLRLSAPCPPPDEQRAIARFLDEQTKKIDDLIEAKRKLLDLLKEKRQAVITHAVTKGLAPNVKLKPSGIDWLGDVPEHWAVKAVKWIARVGNGSTPDRNNAAYWEGGDYPWLNSSVVNQDVVTSAEQFVTKQALAECHLPKIMPPAVLIGITGQGRTRGMATTLLFEATINQHMAYVQPNANIAAVSYLRWVIDTAYEFLRHESEGGGSTKGAITCEQIGALRVPVPPIDEQDEICAYVADHIEKIDALVEEVHKALEHLQEYRTALISATVTGKIDVRGGTS